MKTIVLSFDDGRRDVLENALPLLRARGFSATLNITSDFIEHPEVFAGRSFRDRAPMTVDEIRACAQQGFEIAGHGCRHKNTPEDIGQGLDALTRWGLPGETFGFASPYSALTARDLPALYASPVGPHLSYIRSGIPVRKNGLVYSGLYFLMEKTRSRFLFRLLHRRFVIDRADPQHLYMGINVTGRTTPEQLMALIDRMPDPSGLILILHSILTPGQPGYGTDRWAWTQETFVRFLDLLEAKGVAAATARSMIDRLEGRKHV